MCLTRDAQHCTSCQIHCNWNPKTSFIETQHTNPELSIHLSSIPGAVWAHPWPNSSCCFWSETLGRTFLLVGVHVLQTDGIFNLQVLVQDDSLCLRRCASLSLPREGLQEGPLLCLLMLAFRTAETDKDRFAQGNKHVFLGVRWLLASSNTNCLIQGWIHVRGSLTAHLSLSLTHVLPEDWEWCSYLHSGSASPHP